MGSDLEIRGGVLRAQSFGKKGRSYNRDQKVNDRLLKDTGIWKPKQQNNYAHTPVQTQQVLPPSRSDTVANIPEVEAGKARFANVEMVKVPAPKPVEVTFQDGSFRERNLPSREVANFRRGSDGARGYWHENLDKIGLTGKASIGVIIALGIFTPIMTRVIRRSKSKKKVREA